MSEKKPTTNLRYESVEVHNMVKELSAHFSNSDNGTINYCIKEIHRQTFNASSKDSSMAS